MNTFVKVATVGIFAIALFFLINFIVGQIQEQINFDDLMPTAKYFLCRLGIFQAINIYFSLIIASWFSNKIINYISG